MTNSQDIKIAIVDDHVLFASSLEKLIQTFSGYKVVFHAKNGLDLQEQLKTLDDHPDIILLDINMPVMDGNETIIWLTENHPEIKVLALSMHDSEEVILKMLCNGAKGYLLKDIHPEKLKEALSEVLKKGITILKKSQQLSLILSAMTERVIYRFLKKIKLGL